MDSRPQWLVTHNSLAPHPVYKYLYVPSSTQLQQINPSTIKDLRAAAVVAYATQVNAIVAGAIAGLVNLLNPTEGIRAQIAYKIKNNIAHIVELTPDGAKKALSGSIYIHRVSAIGFAETSLITSSPNALISPDLAFVMDSEHIPNVYEYITAEVAKGRVILVGYENQFEATPVRPPMEIFIVVGGRSGSSGIGSSWSGSSQGNIADINNLNLQKTAEYLSKIRKFDAIYSPNELRDVAEKFANKLGIDYVIYDSSLKLDSDTNTGDSIESVTSSASSGGIGDTTNINDPVDAADVKKYDQHSLQKAAVVAFFNRLVDKHHKRALVISGMKVVCEVLNIVGVRLSAEVCETIRDYSITILRSGQKNSTGCHFEVLTTWTTKHLTTI